MRSKPSWAWAAWLTVLSMVLVSRAHAEEDGYEDAPETPTYVSASRPDPSERVESHDLAGPRIGATFTPRGEPLTQFGWHFENQVAPGKRGPWFIVEKVFLVSGVENNQFIPSATLMFGMRTPSGFEFGLGPSLTIGGYRGANTGIVFAAGQSFRIGGIRIPVNVAYAPDRYGEYRVTFLTGWAVRNVLPSTVNEPVPSRKPVSL
jgi:hypothetical protein